MELEDAVSVIIAGKRRMIRPQNAPIFNKSLEHYIETLQKAPRERKLLNEIFVKNKADRNACPDMYTRDRLLLERDALLQVWSLVMKRDNGMPLEPLAY